MAATNLFKGSSKPAGIGEGSKRQHDTTARYAKCNRIEIAQEFQEKGVTGASARDRRCWGQYG
jgi:hypothetical protein